MATEKKTGETTHRKANFFHFFVCFVRKLEKCGFVDGEVNFTSIMSEEMCISVCWKLHDIAFEHTIIQR